MEIVSNKNLFRDLVPAAQPASFAFSEARRRIFTLVSLIGLATVLRLYAIALYPLAGDEYGTIVEAKMLGLNWNSIIYSSLMNLWIRFGTGEVWLRLPAAIFGIVTVALLFRIGTKLGGWRAGVIAGLLAATSPFNIYHSQEARFYSMFMMSASAFLLATISYVDASKSRRGALSVVSTGALLAVSHFLGLIALYTQFVTMFLAAKKRRVISIVALIAGPAVLIFALPILPPVRRLFFYLYQTFGNAPSARLLTAPLSLVTLAKIGFTGFAFTFGYHVYPLRLALVIPGLLLCGLLLIRGTLSLSRDRWAALPFAYLLVVSGMFLVLDVIGGSVAAGVSPRHISFAWPAFIVVTALGLASFSRRTSLILLMAMLAVNAASLSLSWQKDWTYGLTNDYRAATDYVSSWSDGNSAVIVDPRAYEFAAQYFPRKVSLITPGSGNPEFDQLTHQRLILVTNDWRTAERRRFNEWLGRLANDYTIVDGRVDYPVFQYVLERKSSLPGWQISPEATAQLSQPASIYALELQDLKLPITVSVNNVPLKVMGAYELPSITGSNDVTIPVSHSGPANELVLLTNVVGANEQPGVPLAEVLIENKDGSVKALPLRLNFETASWKDSCSASAPCQTVYRWHKRMVLAGQNSFPDAWRDFQAGLHGTVLTLPPRSEVAKITIRYLSGSGRFYLWGIALAA